MKKLRKIIFFILLILFWNLCYICSAEILSPTFSVPLIVKKGSLLNIVVGARQNARNFKLKISTQYFEKKLTISSKKFENGTWYIKTIIPADTPVELYDLKLICSEGSFVQKRSIKVVDDYKEKFYFIQISDVHIGQEDRKSEKTFAKIIEEVNLLNPEFVVITGDITTNCEDIGRTLMVREGKKVGNIYTEKYAKLNNEEIARICLEEYKKFLNLLEKIRVPTYIIPGNHDMVGIYNPPCKNFYEKMIGRKRYYSFDYRDIHFIFLDNSSMMEIARGLYSPEYPDFQDDLDEEQLKWLEEDLKNSEKKKLKIAFFHCPIHKTDCKFKKLLKDYNVEAGFFGHWHYDFALTRGKPMWIATTSVATPADIFGAEPGYRIVKIKDIEIASYSYSDKKFSFPYNRLNYNFIPANNGKNYEVTCMIKNELKQEFENALVKFFMPKNGEYEIINGKLLQEIVSKNFKILYVNVNISEGETKVVVKKKK